MTQTLEQVAVAFRATLPADKPQSSFRIDHLDRIGVPVVQANVSLGGVPTTSGHGYGFTEIEAAVGAWGELCEELHCNAWLQRTPGIQASYAELLRVHGPRGVADPLTLCLPAGSAYDDAMTLTWVAGRRHGADEPVWVPREWVATYPYQLNEPARLIVPITNGLGAGFDAGHAIAHGVMELLQRDGNVLTYRALDQGVVVDVDTDEGPEVMGLLERLRDLGIAVRVKLACTDFGLTNLYVVGDDHGQPTVPIQVTACGEASHPDRSRALRKALLEFIGSRARKAATHGPLDLLRATLPADYIDAEMATAMTVDETRSLEAMAEWLPQPVEELRRRLSGSVFSERRRVPMSSLPTVAPEAVATGDARLALLAQRLAADGLDILYVDCSPRDGTVSVVKTIVPGLESETMSYHRVGWRGVRRLRERSDELLHPAPGPGLARVRLRPADEERVGGPAWFDIALAQRLVETLYPLYRESTVLSAQMLLQRRAPSAAPTRRAS